MWFLSKRMCCNEIMKWSKNRMYKTKGTKICALHGRVARVRRLRLRPPSLASVRSLAPVRFRHSARPAGPLPTSRKQGAQMDESDSSGHSKAGVGRCGGGGAKGRSGGLPVGKVGKAGNGRLVRRRGDMLCPVRAECGVQGWTVTRAKCGGRAAMSKVVRAGGASLMSYFSRRATARRDSLRRDSSCAGCFGSDTGISVRSQRHNIRTNHRYSHLGIRQKGKVVAGGGWMVTRPVGRPS